VDLPDRLLQHQRPAAGQRERRQKGRRARPAPPSGEVATAAEPRWSLWALAGIVLAGASLRLATLDLQSYTHEEAVTAARVLHASLFDTLSELPDSESTPPLYYLLAWLWSVPFGTGEIALRSISAAAGVATIPVVWLAARELTTRRIALIAAGLIAASPMLVWYSQLARSYSLLVFLSALSFLFTVRALRGSERALALWAAASALALATHYFAAFLVVPEGVLLLYGLRSRSAAIAAAAVCAVGLALLPLAIHQADIPNNDWISNEPLGTRFLDVPRKFLVGETGAYISIYGREGQSSYLNRALLPAGLVVVGVLLLWRLARGRERRGAGLALALAAPAVIVPALLSLAGADYVLARNLLPAYVPAAVAVACGFGARRCNWWGPALATALCGLLVGFAVYTMARPSLRHDDWRAVAADLAPAHERRLLIVPFLGDDPLIYYLEGDVRRDNSFSGPAREVVYVGYGPGHGQIGLPARFSQRGVRETSYFRLTTYRAPRPTGVRAATLARPQLVGSTKAAVLVQDPGG
jgi:mannosyltransferase